AKIASDYADVLYTFFTGIARFKARLNGPMTPVVVWPEHFDLSTLWYLDPSMDEYKAHLDFGFYPFSSDNPDFPNAYLCAYAYPSPPNFQFPELPAPAHWTKGSWTGVVVDYNEIAKQADPASYIESMCMEMYTALRPLLG